MMPGRRQLREPTPSRLSPHAVSGFSPAARQDRLSWEKELLQMQKASAALIKPLGDAVTASIADPRIIAEVTNHVEEDTNASQPNTHAVQETRSPQSSMELHSLAEHALDRERLQPAPRRVVDKVIYVQNARSIASPFFAAAQQFTLLADGEDRKSPPPPLIVPDGADPREAYVGLALQRQTETAEMIIPSASFTSLTSSPTLPEHALTVLPLSPQATAKGFLTADSFQHEPGTTLLDCTDPTPNQSIDLDDGKLKSQLAQLLPDHTFPPSKRVKRNLSCQLSSLSEGPDGADEQAPMQQSGPGAEASHSSLAPGPVSESSIGEPKAAGAKALPPAHKGLRMSETGNLQDGESSQGGNTTST